MKRAAVTAMLLSLVAASSAMADSHHDRRDHRHGEYRNNYEHHERNDGGRYRERQRYWTGEYRRPHGYYHHDWRRGELLPRAYYARPYVVYDYRRCGLRAPPRGHHWVRVNNDALLAVIATGVVLDIVYDNFY